MYGGCLLCPLYPLLLTAISRKVVGKNVLATILKGMGYYQYTDPDTVAVEPTFVAFL